MEQLVGKLAGPIIAAVLLIVLGGAGGVWLSARHYRPLLDDQQVNAAQCTAARDNLAGLTALI